jgi:hypothetical protein
VLILVRLGHSLYRDIASVERLSLQSSEMEFIGKFKSYETAKNNPRVSADL